MSEISKLTDEHEQLLAYELRESYPNNVMCDARILRGGLLFGCRFCFSFAAWKPNLEGKIGRADTPRTPKVLSNISYIVAEGSLRLGQ